MSISILSMDIRFEHDVVLARQRARYISEMLGFDEQEQVRIATAISEIVRNAYSYAQKARTEFRIEGKTAPQVLQIRVADSGKGIANLQQILDGQYKSETGMGMGILGARRLMDQFEIKTRTGANSGTDVVLSKILPHRAPLVSAEVINTITRSLTQKREQNPFEELLHQNQELVRVLDELRKQQEELSNVNRELADTNRGVVALYAELDEKAEYLRRADDLKSEFLSNMSHEFRTPLNSILAISRLLLDRLDGDLSEEQEKQVGFIAKSAESLSVLVNDLLDLARIEAGKTVVRPSEFEVRDLFSALRGMLRPLLVTPNVELIIEEPESVPTLFTDEGKVSQVLRNFISNALKFTERGEVRVSAAYDAPRKMVVFTVADTGIGIPADQHGRIFEEFGQVENKLQSQVKGTGLGLPLSRKLCELLGGRVSVSSVPDMGSTFSAEFPIHFVPREQPDIDAQIQNLDETRPTILILEDDAATVHTYRKMLALSHFQILEVSTLDAAREVLKRIQPIAMIMDIQLRGAQCWPLLAEIKRSSATRDVPIIVASVIEDESKALALGADAYCMKPVQPDWLVSRLHSYERQSAASGKPKILLVDDQEAFRYVVRSYLPLTHVDILEANDGRGGLQLAHSEKPALIFLDLAMPQLSGFEVLNSLLADPVTQKIPVVIVTSKNLTASERTLLAGALNILSKDVFAHADAADVVRRQLEQAGLNLPARPARTVADTRTGT